MSSSSQQRGKRPRSKRQQEIDTKKDNKRLVDCRSCRDGSYQQRMRKKNKKWKPFANGTWKRFLVHFKEQHPKRPLKSSFLIVGFVDDRGYRYEVRNVSEGKEKKSMH